MPRGDGGDQRIAVGTAGYRPEVDGLRAIAVIVVILFHARIVGFGGGFLGVDVFFVLSGYLITGIISRELASDSFSILHFYERRIRRIIPALNVTMLLCIPVAWALMLPDDLENFGQSLIATAVSANNVLLYLTTGYFDLAAEFKPLIHTWSLGVEEQYYVIIPLLLMATFAVAKRSLGAVTAVIAAATLASFVLCLLIRDRYPAANFYLVFSRVWELGAGGLVALTEPAVRSRFAGRSGAFPALSLIGLTMVIAPVFLIQGEVNLPGWLTLLPVAGVVLLLLFADSDGVPGRWLSTRPVVLIGLISYSAYLFHQPVFAFVRISSLSEPSPLLLLALVPLILAGAYLSWRFVEKPFRNRRMKFRSVAAFAAATTLIIIAIGATMHVTSGFYQRWPELADGDPGFGARQNIAYNSRPYEYQDVPLPAGPGQTEGLKVLVVGNSFARDFINMGLETGHLQRHALSYAHIDACTPLSGSARSNAPRADYILLSLDFTAEEVPCVADRVADLRSISEAPVVTLGIKNFGWNNNAVMLLPLEGRYSYRTATLDDAVRANEAGKRLPNYIDLLEMISDRRGRVPVFTPDRKFISQDRVHLTKDGARYIGSILFEHPLLEPIVAQGDAAMAGDGTEAGTD